MNEEEDADSTCDQTNATLLRSDESICTSEDDSKTNDASFEEHAPNAESTVISNGETDLTEEQNESTEADRNHLTKKKRKIQIIKHTTKLNKKMKNSCCSFVTDVAIVDVRGKWVNVSD